MKTLTWLVTAVTAVVLLALLGYYGLRPTPGIMGLGLGPPGELDDHDAAHRLDYLFQGDADKLITRILQASEVGWLDTYYTYFLVQPSESLSIENLKDRFRGSRKQVAITENHESIVQEDWVKGNDTPAWWKPRELKEPDYLQIEVTDPDGRTDQIGFVLSVQDSRLYIYLH